MKKLTCIVCPKGCDICVEASIDGYEISGNKCTRGKEYALNEIKNPKRSITSTVKTVFKAIPRLPVRSDKDIDLQDIFPVMRELSKVEIIQPIHSGEIIMSNILNTGVNIIATSDIYELLEVM